MCAVLCAQESRSLTARGGKGPLPSFDSSGDEGEEDDHDYAHDFRVMMEEMERTLPAVAEITIMRGGQQISVMFSG